MYSLLGCYTHYSLLQSSAKPEQIAEAAKRLSLGSVAITDHNLSGAVDFYAELCKVNIKPILGCTFRINNHYTRILAKNLRGWYELIRLVSLSNDQLVDGQPTIKYTDIQSCDDLIFLTGFRNSLLWNAIFPHADTHVASNLSNNPKIDAEFAIRQYRQWNYYIQLPLGDGSQESRIATDVYRAIDSKLVAGHDINYVDASNEFIYKILLCSAQKTTIDRLSYKYLKRHICTTDELLQCGYKQQEIDNTNIVSDQCEAYNIYRNPELPQYEWTDGLQPMEYLIKLCRDGYRQQRKPDWNKDTYGDRVKKELSVIEEFDLAGYFLIVQDFIRYAKQQGILTGPGRGSVGGSLVAYLLGITTVDPIPNKLLFERFMNSGRMSKENKELPDIDCDFPKDKRDQIIQYIREKYGDSRVGHIVTFGRLMGAGAVKEVLRATKSCSFEEMDKITDVFPEESAISEELENSGTTSVIRWTLENKPDELKEYCRINGDHLEGDYAAQFQHAIDIEGTFKSRGKHAAGIVIARRNLNEYCPMVYDDKLGTKIVGFDMNSSKKVGLAKFDILGLATLSKLSHVNRLLEKKYAPNI